MKILHVIAGAEVGGAETYAADQIKALARAGEEQVVLCRPHAALTATLADEAVRIEPMAFNTLDRLILGRNRIKRLVAEVRPDVVHCWMGRAAALLNRRIDVPTVGWFGGYYDLKRYRGCDLFVTVTRDLTRHVIASGAPEDRVRTVHTFGNLREEPPVDRAELDTPDDAFVILLPARMHWKKGIDTMLEAMTRLPERAVLWLAGDGPDLDKMKALAAELALGDRVRFLGWRNDRFALMASTDVIAMPSRYEPFGTVMAEAWYMRKPLVAADAQGPSQYLEDGANGLLVPKDDAEALAGAMTRLMDSADLRDTLVKGGDDTLARLFTRERSTAEMQAAYADAIRYFNQT